MARNASETTHCGGLKWRQPIVLVQKRRSELKGDRRKSGSYFQRVMAGTIPGSSPATAMTLSQAEAQSFKVSKSGAYPIEIASALTELHAPSDSLNAFLSAARNWVPTL
jgi:hypothetical protein